MTKKVYCSAISYALFTPICVLLFGMLVIAVIYGVWPEVCILSVVIFVLILPMLLYTRYIIDGDVLHIRCGLIIRRDIPVPRIREIKKTSSALSSPALSIKERIAVYYAKYDNIIISPERRSEFIADLQAINPEIKVS